MTVTYQVATSVYIKCPACKKVNRIEKLKNQ